MSDDEEDYYDDDDYFWLDDGPVAEADDLAQHTIHSPVWVDYDPDKDVGETLSDWEYYSDDYFDHVAEVATREHSDEGKANQISQKKRKGSGLPHERAKRRRLDHARAIPELSLGESLDSNFTGTSSSSAVVHWKKKNTFTVPPLPLLADDGGEKVALLKDWRDRFKTRLRDDTGVSEPKSGDCEVPVMKGGLLVIERGDRADGSKDAYDSATGVEVEQTNTEAMDHTGPKATSYEVPTMRNGVVIRERGVHPTVPSRAKTAVNGARSGKRHADMNEESDPRQTKREAIVTSDAQPGTRPPSSPTKSFSRKRRLDDLPEPVEKTGIALRNQEAIQHNLQHNVQGRVPFSAKEPEKLPEAGKENGGMSQAPTARRSKRAKQAS
ncbi:hypothetical protein MMC18_005422 [Xylographa bjoerkii]|nr:hypothetical protein [Xylographa bjoerkii]